MMLLFLLSFFLSFFFSLSPAMYDRKTAGRPTSDVPLSDHYLREALLMSEVIFFPWPITYQFSFRRPLAAQN